MRFRTIAFLMLAGSELAACGGSGGSPSVPALQQGSSRHSGSSSPIQHVVIIVQENRTFNDFFATYHGADGTTVGKVEANSNCSPPIKAGTIALQKVPLDIPKDLVHKFSGYETARDGGNMDGFDKVPFGSGIPECAFPYQYTDPSQIVPYWDMAEQYALAEHMFTTQGSDSFSAHQDLIRGGTEVERDKGMIDFPTCGNCWWGCNAPPHTITHLVSKQNVYLQKLGPFPCSKDFKLKYATLRDLMDAKGVTWKYYQPAFGKPYGQLLSAFDVVWPVRNGPEWKTNIATPQTAIFNDITNGTLPQVSWVIPDQDESDHPGTLTDTGPSWVASVVNAIGQSTTYWPNTAIFIVWDDWGGLYDNLPPKVMDYGGLGFRVPAIVVSPYAKAGYVSQTNYEFGSILRYIEDNWNLGRLRTSDSRAASIIDCFDYSQQPIKFQKIPSSLSKKYFIHARYSGPPDTDM